MNEHDRHILQNLNEAVFGHAVRLAAMECLLIPLLRAGRIDAAEVITAAEEAALRADPRLRPYVVNEVKAILLQNLPGGSQAG